MASKERTRLIAAVLAAALLSLRAVYSSVRTEVPRIETDLIDSLIALDAAAAPSDFANARKTSNRTSNASATAEASAGAPPPRERTEAWWRRGRFPRYGTDEFFRRCRWTTNATRRRLRESAGTECTFYAHPRPSSNEGVAQWVSEVATGSLYALQGGCRLLLDYGPDVDVHKVLAPVDDSSDRNWTVPDGLQCGWKSRCFVAQLYKEKNFKLFARYLGQTLLTVPAYRWIYGKGVDPAQFDELSRAALPGFRIQDGMACTLNSAFTLAPTASEFVPHLFTDILPAIRDEDALVIVLYVRTGNTDKMAKMEKEGRQVKQRSTRILSQFQEDIVQCALHLEGERLSDTGDSPVSSVVWMVITDAPSVGQFIVSKYHSRDAVLARDSHGDGTNVSDKSAVQRKVLTTSTRGVQTRPQRKPSTTDFAEALIDWYLLGESDAVILSTGLSFGATGAMRTSRPVYHAGRGCTEQTMFSKGGQVNHTDLQK